MIEHHFSAGVYAKETCIPAGHIFVQHKHKYAHYYGDFEVAMPTILTDNRDIALKVGYEATDWSSPIAFKDYVQSMSDWSVQGIERDGKCIGAVYKKDGEVHVSILKDWRKRWMTKGLVQLILSPDITRTEVVPGHEYMFGILARLGMKNVGSYKFEVSHGH